MKVRLRATRPDVVVLLALLVFLLAVVVSDELLAHAPHVAALAALLLGLAALAFRAFLGGASFLLVGLVLGLPHVNLGLRSPALSDNTCRVTAITFNAKQLRVADLPALIGLLERNPADVIFLQETPPAAAFREALARSSTLADRSVALHAERFLAIISRFPLSAAAPARDWLQARATLPGGTSLLLVTGVAPKPHVDAQEAQAYAARLEALAAQANGQMLAGMDMNAGPHSAIMRGLPPLLTDAHAAAGAGFGFTFPTVERQLGRLGPWLRIDYLLAGAGLRPVATRVLEERARSTHLPLSGTFAVTGVPACP